MSLKNLLFSISIFVLIIFSSCEKEEFAKVLGYIRGYVYDGTTNKAIENVKVKWISYDNKDSTISTAKSGYEINKLYSGDYSIWFSKTDYTTIVLETSIPLATSAGAIRSGINIEYVKICNPNLYPLNVTLTGRIYKKENGIDVPAEGAIVQLDYNGLDEESEESFRFVPGLYTALTDANGYYTFTNVPGTDAYIRFLDYTDTNGDVYYDSETSSYNDNYRKIFLNPGSDIRYRNIFLDRIADGIRLINTNAWASTGVGTTAFDIASSIELTFNKTVDQDVTLDRGFITLTVGGADVETTISFADNVITIAPTQNLSPNTSYSVNYSVYSSLEYDLTTSSITFTTLDDAIIPVQVTGLALNMGSAWKADYNTTDINFEFSTITDATAYEIYAADNDNNIEFIYVNTISQGDNYVDPMQYIGVDLSSVPRFDYYFNDEDQTPFSHGTQISFKVRAKNSAGYGPFSEIVSVIDKTPLDGDDIYLTEGGTSDVFEINDLNNTNSTVEDVTVHLYISGSQYFTTSAIPTITVIENSGGGTVNINATNVTFIDHQHLTFVVSIPAYMNLYGGVLLISGLTDSSGNTQAILEDFQ